MMIPHLDDPETIPEGELYHCPILVCDDQETTGRLIAETLAAEGFHDVTRTTDPRRALELQISRHFDLIVLDLVMPGMDGFQVLEMLRQVSAEEPPVVIALTVRDDREARVRALGSGASDFVSKPFDRVELATRIRNLLRARLLERRLRQQNELLRRQVRERTQALRESWMDVYTRLAEVAEQADPATPLHLLRVSRYATLLGEAAGLDAGTLRELRAASPLHDIGMVVMADEVLARRGPLDAEERALLRRHPEVGARILRGADLPVSRMAREIALGHHEHWDGSGYPRGLAGDEIPLVARIVAIADVFAALTADRPYRPARAVDEALAWLRERAGHRFDPGLVTAFLGREQEVRALAARYRQAAGAAADDAGG